MEECSVPMWGQQTLWPVYEEDHKDSDGYLCGLLAALGIPTRHAKSAQLRSFSDGSANVTLAFDLTSEETRHMTAESKNHG